MNKFMVSLPEMQGNAKDIATIVSSYRKKIGTLESLGSSAQAHSRRAGKRILNVSCQLREMVTRLSQMSETLNCVAGLYQKAENEVVTDFSSIFDIWNGCAGGVIDFTSADVQETLGKIKDKGYTYSAIWPGVIGSMFMKDIGNFVRTGSDEKKTLLGKAEVGEIDGGKYGFGTHDKKRREALGKSWEYEYDEKQKKLVKKVASDKPKEITEKDIAESITIAEFTYSFLDEDEKGVVIGETEDGAKITLDKKDVYIKNKLTFGDWESSIGGSYSMMSIETGEGKVGDEMLGFHGSAGVDFLATSASLKAGIGWLNDKGEIDPHLYGGVNMEAVVAKASGEVGVDLLGADVNLKGSVGIGLGFHADVGLNDGKLEFNLGGYIGIGGDISLEVDLSGAIETVDKVVDFAGDAVGAIGDAVGDVVKEGAEFIGDIGNAIFGGWKKISLW